MRGLVVARDGRYVIWAAAGLEVCNRLEAKFHVMCARIAAQLQQAIASICLPLTGCTAESDLSA